MARNGMLKLGMETSSLTQIEESGMPKSLRSRKIKKEAYGSLFHLSYFLRKHENMIKFIYKLNP